LNKDQFKYNLGTQYIIYLCVCVCVCPMFDDHCLEYF
jgi:hypothetical protein